eukprot:2747774-Alexandrium_andersonii.AAC.1
MGSVQMRAVVSIDLGGGLGSVATLFPAPAKASAGRDGFLARLETGFQSLDLKPSAIHFALSALAAL